MLIRPAIGDTDPIRYRRLNPDGQFSGNILDEAMRLIKIIFWDGTGLCLFTKRLEHGVFLWPSSVEPGETLSLTSAQLSSLIDGVDWRAPEQRWRPAVAG
jgi:transposase